MSSDERPPAQPSQQRPTSGPYIPRNSLHSSTQPTFPANSSHGRSAQPVFGSTTPMKSTLSSRSAPWANTTDRDWSRPGADAPPRRPFVSEVKARASQYMEPIRATAPSDAWRTHQVVVDLTADEQIIRPPTDYPTFATHDRRAAFTSVNRGVRNDFVDLTDGPSNNRRPPVYSLPGGGAMSGMSHFAGEYVDTAKTTESIKELLEGINDEPVVPRRIKKKKKGKLPKKEEDDLANMLASAGLDGRKKEGEDLAHRGGKSLEEPIKEEEEEGEEEEEEEDLSRVEGLTVPLLPHQVRGRAFMLSREEGKAKGGILADDMGLGKTIQSIVLILSHPHPKFAEGTAFTDLSPNSKSAALELPKSLGRGTLVVTPLALMEQWKSEIEKFTEPTHKLRVKIHHGPNRAKDPSALRRYDVVITTYDVIRSEHNRSSFREGGDGEVDAVGCFGIRWWRIICDEAHTIKNRLAKTSLAACALKARYRWCLTGTPLQNNLDELQSLLKFLRIAPFDDLAVWKEQISRPMQQNKGNIAIERLRVVLGAVMLRRTKDILKRDAEGKSGNQIKIMEREMEKVVREFNPQEQAFYDKLEERTEESLEKMMAGFGEFGGKLGGTNMTSALVLLLRLRQACNHPHLLAGKIHKDRDSGLGLSTPRKKKTTKSSIDDAVEDDEIADLMGGLSVDQQKCEVCFRGLTRDQVADGEVRCNDCTEDLKVLETPVKKKSKKMKKVKKVKRPQIRGRPTIFDSDDEDDDAGSQAEEGTDTEEEEEEDEVGGQNDGLIDSQAEESSAEQEDGDSDFGGEADSHLQPSTKITSLIQIIRKEIKQKNKIIIFSQFTSMLDLIEPFLHRKGITFTRYDGSMKNDDREASLRRLRGEGEFAPRRGREDKDWCGVLLCSLKCGALGLNLTCASRVVILEPFWNPFIEEQAIDRVHRIGQTKDVIVYKLTIANSVEERILTLQDRKRELAKAAIGDGDMQGKAKAAKMSMKDIMFLFKRDAEGKYQEAPSLNAKTRILKERRHTPRSVEVPAPLREGRYASPMELAEMEARRAREHASIYSRR